MKRLALVAALMGAALLLVRSPSGAGPLEGGKVYENQVIAPGKPFESSMNFKGGERAGVMAMVKGEEIAGTDLFIEIRDTNGQLITKDDAGGAYASVIWYPPQDAIYQIRITLKGSQSGTCYIAVR